MTATDPRKIQGKMILIFLFLIMVQCSFSQESKPAWDLKQCIEYAKKNNIQLNTLRLTASSGKQDLLLSKYAKYPDLNGTISKLFSYSDKTALNSTAYGISSSMVLFKGNYYNNDIRSNALSLQADNLNVAEAENDIILEITQAYLNILLAHENIEYVKNLVSTSESQVEQYQQKFNSGTVALKDLKQLQATLANDKYTLVQAENAKRQNILTLKIILQLPSDTTLNIKIPETMEPVTLVTPLDTVQKTALEIMPQIKSSDILVNKQTVELAKAKAGYLPTLSLTGSMSTGYISNRSDSYLDQMSAYYTPQIGLTLSIPIFSKKANSVAVAKTKISLEQAKLTSQNTRTELAQTVEQAYINVQNAQSQYNAAREQLDYAKETFRISDEELKIGARNNVEYLQQKNLYVQALQQFIQAKYSMILYLKIYNFYKGIPVTA